LSPTAFNVILNSPELASVDPVHISFPVPTPESLETAPQVLTPQRAAALVAILPLLQELAARQSYRMAIKTKGKIVFIDTGNVTVIQVKGKRVLLQETSGTYELRETISNIARKLAAHGFVRIHRSVLVNAALVREIQPWPTGEYVLRMEGGEEYTVTRTYKRNLILLAESWIGTTGFAAELAPAPFSRHSTTGR
jgi:DNA-binding LytR/AlgR family response regulator